MTAGASSKINYTLLQSNPENAFDIDTSTGAIYSTLPVDYEKVPFHWMIVLAVDNSQSEPQSTGINVTVSCSLSSTSFCTAAKHDSDGGLFPDLGIGSERQHAYVPLPCKDQHSGEHDDRRSDRYALSQLSLPSAPCDLDIDSVVFVWNSGQVSASDMDSGPNSEIIYKIAAQYPEQPRDLFSIDPNTGQLKTSTSVDYERTSSVFLVVKATGQLGHNFSRTFY